MARYAPSRPGWYRNPEDPGSLRYWDGRSWTGRARPQPLWASRAEPFETLYEDLDRSVEGPVRTNELREPVASGAGSREWLSWRARQASAGWHRGRSAPPALRANPQRTAAPNRHGPSRRPLLAVMCLLVVAVGVVVSSVAFISPYETKSTVQVADELAAARFSSAANKQCAAFLPRYRGTLAWGDDGPTIEAAASRVDQLSQRISLLVAPVAIRGPLQEWVGTLKEFAEEQERYAGIIGPATRLTGGRLVARRLAPTALVNAAELRQEASELASRADTFSATLQLQSCRLEPDPGT
ncbi:MAG TPA: DUF2510 domain-containing protein [Acidimicrobiales bacterium]|nr:DUF2510 domain-containing protein [Acidimicrobiales bacterium]